MKATYLFKAIAFVAVILASAMNSEMKAQESNFITNEEISNEQIVAKTIYKQDGSQLYRHLRYEFTYDEQQRLASKTALKWDAASEKWTPYFQMTYAYNEKEIIMSYARWNQSHKAYDKDVKQSVYELNDENMPVACKTYEQQENSHRSDWTLVSFPKTDHTVHPMA